MPTKKVEEIIENAYMNLLMKSIRVEKRAKDITKPGAMIHQLPAVIRGLILALGDNNMTTDEVNRHVGEAKLALQNLCDLIAKYRMMMSKPLKKNVGILIRLLSHCEAVAIECCLGEELNIVSIERVFDDGRWRRELLYLSAVDIIGRAWQDMEQRQRRDNDFRPACKSGYVTVFVDEAIRHYSLSGICNASEGRYSYVLCQGKLESEDEIEDTNMMEEGVESIKETTHVGKVTEAAIGKVLLLLLSTYHFTGKVCIYTDNIGTVTNWMQSDLNRWLGNYFQLVSVKYIPRGQNTYAHKLVNESVSLNLTKEEYREVSQLMCMNANQYNV